MKQIKLIIICLLIFSCNNSNETKEKERKASNTFTDFTKVVDGYAEAILQNGNVNSFALAVYKNGEAYHNYYGEIDKNTIDINDSLLFEIASITKTFTGSLVAKAVLDGKINLDDDIRKYLVGAYSNLEFEGHPITIKNLLTHSLGLKHKTPKRLEAFNEKINKGIYTKETDSYTIKDLLKELETVEVDKTPGTVFAYNSVGPELLAYILETVNKESFQSQIEKFLTEVGMHNTYLQDSEKHKKRLVKGYRNGKLANMDFCPLYGAAGGAIATLPDLAIYMQYLITHKNEPWVKEASRSLFVDLEDDENIGYLWQNIGFADEEGYFYSKTGTSNGIQSGVLICPDSNYGIVLIVNNVSDAAFNDWATLFFNNIEPDLIKYPKLNLFSTLKAKFIKDPKDAFSEYRMLKKDTATYFTNSSSINNFGYKLLQSGQKKKAIVIFKLITEEFPENANAYDSLGEAYFVSEDYDNALLNYKKSLTLNPNNDNAKKYINKIEQLSL